MFMKNDIHADSVIPFLKKLKFATYMEGRNFES